MKGLRLRRYRCTRCGHEALGPHADEPPGWSWRLLLEADVPAWWQPFCETC